jgi:restriction system protein
MSLPNYTKLMLPLLELASRENKRCHISDLRKKLADYLSLGIEDLESKQNNGRKIFDIRVGWAVTDNYLTKFNEFREFQEKLDTNAEPRESEVPLQTSEIAPEESVSQAISILNTQLREEILEKIKQLSPEGFERLVLRLLHSMGYGGSIKDVKGVPRGPDGGIDGTIKEDKFCLDVIYIQAKRWNTVVGREKIQAFQGALAGVGATKGVFITTSTFTPQARGYVNQLRGTKIILVDGEELAQLMVEHNVGVSIKDVFYIKRIDEDLFLEEDF